MTSEPDGREQAGPRAILYDAAGHDRDVHLDDVKVEDLASDQLLWVDVVGEVPATLPAELQSAVGRKADLGQLELSEGFYRFAIPLRDNPEETLRFAVGRSWVVTASDKRIA